MLSTKAGCPVRVNADSSTTKISRAMLIIIKKYFSIFGIIFILNVFAGRPFNPFVLC